MMRTLYRATVVLAGLVVLLGIETEQAAAQFTGQWLDIGSYHVTYSEAGAKAETASGIAEGGEWPAIMRSSGHVRGRAHWIGTKNWTDERGQSFPFYVSRVGPRNVGIDFAFPVQNKLIARYEDTEVTVDGALSFDNVAVVEEVDPSIAADRMVDNIYNQKPGITVRRQAYAYTNEYFDNFQVQKVEYCNTGNVDGDEEIELPGQNLEGVYFFRIYRFRGQDQASRGFGGDGQVWGRFSMNDAVGDGHAEYPVDFSAQWTWYGYNPNFTEFTNLGSPRRDDSRSQVAPGDTVGRISGMSMSGVVTLHADTSPDDPTYVRCTPATFDTCQPHTMGFMDQDEVLTGDSASQQDYYELGILTRENPDRFPSGSSRMFPHYADRIEPNGLFWEPTSAADAGGKQGGHAFTDAYGPYDMDFGDCVTIAYAEGASGLSYHTSVQIGRKFKQSGFDESALIEYDANGDGVIDTTPFNYDDAFVGTEAQTKNQWVMTERDSLFKTFQRAVDLWGASNQMTVYPIPEPPRAPLSFDIFGRPDRIELSWEPNTGGPPITGWELYRTTRFEDNLLDPDGDNQLERLQNGDIVTGYELIAELPANATSFDDVTANRGTDYYYYLQAVGEPQPNDPTGLNGTPGGVPLRSGRYLTQSYFPVNLKRPPFNPQGSGTVSDARVVPNPVNLGADATVRFSQEDRVAFFNIPGNATIKIFTEIGELVHTIEHTDGSGDETWNLTTESRQLLVSGIYIAVIEDLDRGESTTLKFTVIR